MKILIIVLAVAMAAAAPICTQADAEAGLLYNPDAYGITSHVVAHAAAGYVIRVTECVTVDIQVRHESYPENSGDDNESAGVLVRYTF